MGKAFKKFLRRVAIRNSAREIEVIGVRVKRLVIVLHRIARLHRPYGLNTDYANLVGKALQDHRLKETDCFTEYELDQWWAGYPGIRDFGTEVLKLAYYLIGGYIPLKLSYCPHRDENTGGHIDRMSVHFRERSILKE